MRTTFTRTQFCIAALSRSVGVNYSGPRLGPGLSYILTRTWVYNLLCLAEVFIPGELILSPTNKLSSAKCLVLFNFQSASLPLKVGEWYLRVKQLVSGQDAGLSGTLSGYNLFAYGSLVVICRLRAQPDLFSINAPQLIMAVPLQNPCVGAKKRTKFCLYVAISI